MLNSNQMRILAEIRAEVPRMVASASQKSDALAKGPLTAFLEAPKRLMLRHDLPIFIDFGRLVEVYESCETAIEELEQKLPSREACDGLADARLAVASIDIQRRLKTEHQKSVFEEFAGSQDLYCRGRALSGLGLIDVYDGKNALAVDKFKAANDCFATCGYEVEALKACIRIVMVLRIEGKFEEANGDTERILDCALELGVDALSPILYCLSIFSSNAWEMGKKFEARSLAREAAKLANILPPCASAAFAMLFYGQVLLHLHSPARAIEWLYRAETIQKTHDPLARTVTLNLIGRCLRESGRLVEARAALEKAHGSRVGDIVLRDLGETLEELCLVLLASHAVEEAQEMAKNSTKYLHLEKEEDPDRLRVYLDRIDRYILEHRNVWRQAMTVSTPCTDVQRPVTRCYIDFNDRTCTIIGRDAKEVQRRVFRKGSGVELLLRTVWERLLTQHHMTSRAFLKSILSTENTSQSVAALRLARAIDDLIGMGVLTQTLHDHFSFVESAIITVREPIQNEGCASI